MELWDLYDRDRKKTGLSQIRGEPIPEGSYHLVVHVWIRNGRGEYLISQRSPDREKDPLKWECVGGSALMGDDSLSAASREVQEEVGVVLSPNQGKIVKTMLREHLQDIVDVWLFEYDGKVDISKASTKEVVQAHWMEVEDIRALADKGELQRNLLYFFDEKSLGRL